jgi:bifunctional DNA-binding transcriptional regulator/antitoxin component of YhaV-PrlF toxin-antitoxin module
MVRKLLDIEEGDFVEIEVRDGLAVLTPKKLIDKDQAWFWTKEWQEGEREASEDIAAGRVKAFESVEDLIKDLNADAS